MGTTGGGGTSADIIPTQIIFGVDPCKRCWDIAQKPPKCRNSPLTPIVTKISFPPFSARRGPPTPKRGEDTFGTRVRSHAKFGVNWPAGCREIVDKKTNKTAKVKEIPRPSLYERMAGKKDETKTITIYIAPWRLKTQRRSEDRELNHARSKPHTIDWPVSTARTFVHHYNSIQHCST